VRWGEVSFKPQGLKLTSPHLTDLLGWGGTSLKAQAFKLVPPHPRINVGGRVIA